MIGGYILEQDNIKVLDTKAQCREKISIWFGSSSNYYHPIKEILSNSTDEIINHFESGIIEIILHDDLKTITIKDSGRGIPIDGETDGIKNYELLLKTLFAGTKYEQDDKNTTGTNGVGLTVINHTSELFEVISTYNGFKYSIKYKNGGELVHLLKKEKCNRDEHGTTITFKLDAEVYKETTYDINVLKETVKRFAVSSSKVELIFKYQEQQYNFHYNNLEEYFKEVIGQNSTSAIATIPNTLYEDDNEKTQIHLILTSTPEPIQEAYLNLTYLEEDGAINAGVLAGIRAYTSKYCKNNRLYPNNLNSFTMADIEASVAFVAITLSNNVEFKNQTKLSTNKTLYEKVAQKHTMKLLEIFQTENETGFKKFINHLLAVQRHNEISEKANKALKKKLTEKIDGLNNRVSNLVDCKIQGPEAEIFIAEGLSALGSIVLARDAKFQAAYPL
jgi:DNA gyrase subunit B